uniref:Uncharacterized protein n=1 Tax=Arundo donax TaxID=35708 RepID=A0A0A9GXL0_ARUDO
MQPEFLEQDNCLTFCTRKFNATCSYQLEVSICAQEAGAKDIFKSPYSYYLYSDVPSSSLPDIIRLRAGNVQFNYKYGNSMDEKEVTEDFTCPICLVKCGSFMVMSGTIFFVLSSYIVRFYFLLRAGPKDSHLCHV